MQQGDSDIILSKIVTVPTLEVYYVVTVSRRKLSHVCSQNFVWNNAWRANKLCRKIFRFLHLKIAL